MAQFEGAEFKCAVHFSKIWLKADFFVSTQFVENNSWLERHELCVI